ncbi:NAD(P)H-dependent flavin oxidoreductase [Roseospira navarrensis]|uniref:Nitronate monooxygenase n=1 Tax=Roseospira navarrensis TaxID=140058 RepID=A0A7X2D1D8_9PROT|nr:nitronate monooxygenase [Roseospira navarrensis]MQX35034.1 nitronate monooxygenase [Roseospira navarrensis]
MARHTAPLFETAVTRLLGIRHPILCGGLMWLSTAPYVAAVGRAGGIGFLTARTFPDLGAFRAEIQACRDLAAGAPFGVNLHLSHRPEANALMPAYVRVLVEEGVRVVETSGLSPTALLPALREGGCTVLHKVAAIRHAERAARDGVDAVTVVGAECGGHPGPRPLGTMVQTPLLAARALPVPVLVGGGIGTGAQIVAALAMGAAGVVLGTRMLVAEELQTDPAIKRRMVEADAQASRLVLAGHPAAMRVLDNATARAVADLEATGETDFAAYRPLVEGGLQKQAYQTGDADQGLLSMGPAVAFADRVEPVAAIYDRLLTEAAAALETLGTLTLHPHPTRKTEAPNRHA